MVWIQLKWGIVKSKEKLCLRNVSEMEHIIILYIDHTN